MLFRSRLLLKEVPGSGNAGLATIFFLHFLPSVFLPWSPRESLRPVYPLLAMFILENVVLKVAGRTGTSEVVGMLVGAPFMLVPGLVVNWWRLRTHRRRVLAYATGKDDGIGSVERGQIRPDVLLHAVAENVDRHCRARVALAAMFEQKPHVGR